MRCSGPFTPVYVHTAKCSVCDRRNRNTLQKCAECGEQFCNTCFAKLGSRRFHGPPDISVFPSTTQSINNMPPVMSASVRASMSTQQDPSVRITSTPSRGRGSIHRRLPSRLSPSATFESPAAPHVEGTATSPVVLDDSPSYRAHNRAMEPASASSSRTFEEPMLTPRRSARFRPHVPSYNELDSPEPVQARPNIIRPGVATSSPLMSDEPSPLNTKYTLMTPPPRPAPEMSVLNASRNSLPDSPTNMVFVQGSRRRLAKKIPPPQGLNAADCKQDLALMTPSDEERMMIEAVRSSGTLETGASTTFARYANRLSRRPSSFPTLKECLSQREALLTASLTPVSGLTDTRPMQRTIASSSQAPTSATAHAQRVQHQPQIPVIILDDSDDEDEIVRPPNHARLLGHQPPRVTPVAEFNVTPGPQAMRTTPLLSAALERLAERSPIGNKYLDVLMTARPIKQEPSSVTYHTPTIGSVEAAYLGKDGATPMEAKPDLQEGAVPYAGSIDSVIGGKSSPIKSMPTHNKRKLSDIEEDEEFVPSAKKSQNASQGDGETGPAEVKHTVADGIPANSSRRRGRGRPKKPLPPPISTSPSRRLATSATPRTPRRLEKTLGEDQDTKVGEQTRQFNKYLDSIPLRKDFYINKNEDQKPLSNKPNVLRSPEPSLDNDSRGKSQSDVPAESQTEETPDKDYVFDPNGPNPESRVRYEVYGRPNQAPPISPTEFYRQRKNNSSQMLSSPTHAAAFGSITNTPPASSGPMATGSRTPGESASSYIPQWPFSERDDDDSRARRNVNRLAEYLANDDIFKNNTARTDAELMPPPPIPPRRRRRGRGNGGNVQTQPKRRRRNPKNDDQAPSLQSSSVAAAVIPPATAAAASNPSQQPLAATAAATASATAAATAAATTAARR